MAYLGQLVEDDECIKTRSERQIKKNNYMKEYYRIHPEFVLRRRILLRDYCREHRIMEKVNGRKKTFYVPFKRPIPDRCELCGRSTPLLYHRCASGDIVAGMWVCSSCHKIAHGIEKGVVDVYIKLKKQAEEEVMQHAGCSSSNRG